MKRILFLVLSLLMLTGCGKGIEITIEIPESTTAATHSTQHTGTLEVHYIDVGQGDAILLMQGDKSMLIDAGENDKGGQVVKYLQNKGISHIDYLVGTHPHSDHIGGLDNVIKAFDIGQIIMPKVSHTTATYKDVLTSAKNKGYTITGAKAGQTYDFGDAKIQILSPVKDSYYELNEYSIVMKVVFGENRFLFTGDMESYNENELLKAKADLRADVLKVAHHGSYTSSTEEFLEAVGAKYSVISVGNGNDYGHPHNVVTRRLMKTSEIYRTDTLGTVIAISDGKNITITTERTAIE